MAERVERDLVILLDVDNTLLDNDRVANDLREHLQLAFGAERERRYWQIFEQLRDEVGYADYLGALQRYRVENPVDSHLLETSLYLVDYPFSQRLYPGVPTMLSELQRYGLTVILSDGDVVFQPRKVSRSGLWEAVGGRVLIYVHKEEMLPDVERRYPARRYLVVDDKLRILSAAKSFWQDRVTTVWPRQGHYALDPTLTARYPAPDVALERVTDLIDWLETSLSLGQRHS
jgi:FMN phosphatase YigB (HAD superfamily)